MPCQVSIGDDRHSTKEAKKQRTRTGGEQKHTIQNNELNVHKRL
jgi:hypothetical protein